jgi:peptidoglycan/LPS O-acetylase OafA/YrhL
MYFAGIDTDTNLYDHLTSLKGLFMVHPEISPCGYNVTIWFLVALFVVQVFYYANCKLVKNRYIIVLVALALHPLGYLLTKSGMTGFFYLNEAFTYYIYYVLGSLTGTVLMEKLNTSRRNLLIVSAGCLSALIVITLLDSLLKSAGAIVYHTFFEIRIICFGIPVFIFFKNTSRLAVFQPLRFFGQHSLELLVTHGIVLAMLRDLILLKPSLTENSLIYSIILFIALLTTEYFIILFLNRFVPKLIGKKDLIPIK